MQHTVSSPSCQNTPERRSRRSSDRCPLPSAVPAPGPPRNPTRYPPRKDPAYKRPAASDGPREKYQKDSNIIKQLNYEDWSLDDLIEIGEEFLSCINKHAITNNLLKIKESMKKVGINEKQILKFMQEYIKELFDEYGE